MQRYNSGNKQLWMQVLTDIFLHFIKAIFHAYDDVRLFRLTQRGSHINVYIVYIIMSICIQYAPRLPR